MDHKGQKSLMHLYNSVFHEPMRCAEPKSEQWSFKNSAKVVITHNRFRESPLKTFKLYSNFTRQTSWFRFQSSHSIACSASFSSNPSPYPSYLGNQKKKTPIETTPVSCVLPLPGLPNRTIISMPNHWLDCIVPACPSSC